QIVFLIDYSRVLLALRFNQSAGMSRVFAY
ncbi:MAG: hypothetical protein ACI9WS_001241, partial [Paraglaciecola psychrophila]